MTRHPYAVPPRARLSSARALMDKHKIRHLPVIDRDELVGILSDQDLRTFHAPEDNVVDAMSVDVAAVAEATPLNEVVTLMEAKQLGSVVILGKAGVEGIFTRNDAMRAFCDVLQRDEASQR